MFDAKSYLERFGATAGMPLAALHHAHLQTVPFENLDIHLKRLFQLDEEAFFDKVVVQRRGGICYELNGLFARLLRTLGYGVTLLSARVATQPDASTYGPDFAHVAILVEDASGRWLADVGFGDCFLEPLRLDERGVQVQAGRGFRLTEAGGELVVWSESPTGGWEAEYAVSLTPRKLGDFAEMSHYTQTSPQSHFTQRRVCTRVTPDGRITLKDDGLLTTRNGVRHEEPLADAAAWNKALATHFGITLPADR
ncbi:arylamine N-acetyltransferase family protein [Pyxidicoccus sp. MSG2]|uniref:arylamine N-acetyltransferase family protein n=1 Tax=Pyxidicoccus sp. MSG2 TaxID=2996790 RepID=UPI002270B662|nr:arylamine N-acetyltransferase [Pyxidicoccus sp. MSG2]MCY1020113.1 arylamine N-acetyltransferase [Pyxidicoccus sp. MSG2]